MLAGLIRREPGGWYAECPLVGAYTQGFSRNDARVMLADCVEVLVHRPDFKARVTELGPPDATGSIAVIVDSTTPAALAAEVLRYQRQRHRLTTAEVANRLGASSVNAYAAYEQGKREPTLTKFRELLRAIAPEMVLTFALEPRGKRSRR